MQDYNDLNELLLEQLLEARNEPVPSVSRTGVYVRSQKQMVCVQRRQSFVPRVMWRAMHMPMIDRNMRAGAGVYSNRARR
jgi:hypothetical protein